MVPISQINIGGDPLLGTPGFNIEEQLRQLEARRQTLESMKQLNPQAIPQASLIWNEIDAEVKVLSNEQLQKLFENTDYARIYNKIQEMVGAEILNLVKARIESTPEGKQLLTEQLTIVRKLKPQILEEANREVELFRRFREFSKTNPEVTYEEFLKQMNA